MICWKIRIFAYWTTPGLTRARTTRPLWFAEKFVSLLIEQHPLHLIISLGEQLWFAEKFVSLLIEQHRTLAVMCIEGSCDLLKNSYLCLLNNTRGIGGLAPGGLWFAEKFVSLLIEQHLSQTNATLDLRCDLLKNSYLCLLNNTTRTPSRTCWGVVICWKIRIFAYWTTPGSARQSCAQTLWFAEKFVSLLIEQHQKFYIIKQSICCDLLKNSYLCLLNNTCPQTSTSTTGVVICWKIRIFAYWTTPKQHGKEYANSCDLLKNSYLCLLNNTNLPRLTKTLWLWFAEKFVSLLIEQHLFFPLIV